MIHLSAYVVGPDGQQSRLLAGPATYAPTELPQHTTVELPCGCPTHRDGQPLHPERDRGLPLTGLVDVNRTADDLGGQGQSGGLS
jgi:hypothetical protein